MSDSLIFENIPITDVNLIIIHLLKNSKMFSAQTEKIRINQYLLSIFQNVIIHDNFANEKYEPTPENQYKMIAFENLSESLKIAGMMYIKGMDTQFWNLILGDLDQDPKNKKIAEILFTTAEETSKNNPAKLPIIWVFTVIWKYFQINDFALTNHQIYAKFGFANETEIPDVSPIKIYRTDYWENSDYFNVEQTGEIDLEKLNVPSNLQISRSDKDKYCIKNLDLGDELTPAKYNFDEVLSFSTARSKKTLHLSDLGTLQITCLNKPKKKSYLLHCWLGCSNGLNDLSNSNKESKRYLLKAHNTKELANKSYESDLMMNKHYFNYPWSEISNVICIAENIDNNRVIDKKTYYTILPAPPYSFKFDYSWCLITVFNQVSLLNIIKYIFGIPDRIAESCHVYPILKENQIQYRICSYDHGPILTELKGSLLVNFANSSTNTSFASETQWLRKMIQEINKKYYTRACEILQLISNV